MSNDYDTGLHTEGGTLVSPPPSEFHICNIYSANNMITYTSKKKLFVITALLCDLFTSIYAWQRRIYIRKYKIDWIV